jgi:hypothetical protein
MASIWQVFWDGNEPTAEWDYFEVKHPDLPPEKLDTLYGTRYLPDPAQMRFATEGEAREELIRQLRQQRWKLAERILELGGTP